MDATRDSHTKSSQKEKDKYLMISLTCGIQNMAQIKPTKQKQTHRHREQTCSAKGEGRGSRMDWEFGVSRCKLLHLEWMDNKVLPYV